MTISLAKREIENSAAYEDNGLDNTVAPLLMGTPKDIVIAKGTTRNSTVSEPNGLDNTVAHLLRGKHSSIQISKGPTFGIRHMQTLLIFLDILVIYISRLNVGMAVVAMTNAETTNPDFPEFDWSEKEISYILSSFYWGYVWTQFPGGALCKRFGVKLTVGLSTFGSMIMSGLTPWCVTWGGWQAFCVIRLVQGLCQGMIFPCMHQHLANWAPVLERNRLSALSHTGLECGTVLAMVLSGIIAEGPMGWPGISYFSAGISLVFCILWFLFAANNTTESRFITASEKQYIESSLKRDENFHKKKIPIPWRAIFTSMPFWALLVARSFGSWGVTTLQAQIPSYLNGVLGMDIRSNALFSGLPFLVMWIMSYVYVIVADILQSKQILSLSGIRKTINSIAFWIPATALIAIGFLDKENRYWAIALTILSVGANSGATIGSSLNTIDLSPNHAGILMGIVNTVANFMPLVSPLVVGVVITDSTNRSQWQIVFAIAAVIFFVGNLFFIISGKTSVQPWNAEDYMRYSDADRCIEDPTNKKKLYPEKT